MIHDIPKPDISDDFTMEDLYKIKEWNYERWKDATQEEISADIEAGAARVRRAMEELRKKKQPANSHALPTYNTEKVLSEKIKTIS